MLREWHGRLFVLVASSTAAASASGCNAIFGIREGLPGDGGAGGGGAGGGSAVCPPEKPATCDPTYLSDGDNCCAAGRSCQGGACLEGVCQSVVHGQTVEAGEAIGVVRSGDMVIWSGGWERALYMSDVDGDGFTLLMGQSQNDFNYVTNIAADKTEDGYVFFTDYGGSRIGRAKIEGGQTVVLAQVPEAVVPGAQARRGRILVHGDHVYWAMDFQATDQAGNQVGKHIWRALREPRDPPALAEMVVMTAGAFGIAADDKHLYFGSSDMGDGQSAGTIERVAWADIDSAGGDPQNLAPREVLAQGQGLIGEVAVDGERVYWAFENQVRYQDKDLPNSTISTVFGLDSYVWGIEPDGRDVYISTVGDSTATAGALWRVPAGTLADPELLYRAEAHRLGEYRPVYDVTEDCDTVFFVVQHMGFVRRLTK